MKKFITTLCLILCFLLAFSAVGCTKQWKVEYVGGEVSSNGGFSVEVGDYVYFINGVATATDNNNFGKPVKGSLVRMKKADLVNPQAETSKAEVVVPKLFASSYYETGITIFGDYVYYASPNAETNKKGEVLNTEIVYYKTKLDGTDTKKIVVGDTLSQEYKFVQVGQDVYLITVKAISSDSSSSDSSSSNSSSSTYTIKVYNANTGAELFVKEDADTYALPTEIIISESLGYVFFTDKIQDEDKQDKEYGALYAYKLGEDKAGVLISGAIVSDGTFGTKGYLFKAIKYANGCLYFTGYNVNSSEDGLFYYFMDLSDSAIKVLDETSDTFDADNKANYNLKTQIDDVLGASVKKAIAKTSIFNSKNSVVYFDSAVGLLDYDYNSEVATICVYASQLSTLTTPSFKTIINGFAYFVDSSNILYRIKIQDSSAKLQKIMSVTTNSSWYNVEVVEVGGIEYVLTNVNAEPYSSYIYALEADVEAKIARENQQDLPEVTASNYQKELDEMVQEYFDNISTAKEDGVNALLSRRVGVISSNDNKSINSFINSNFSSSSSED